MHTEVALHFYTVIFQKTRTQFDKLDLKGLDGHGNFKLY